jgi:hypothetical protein
MGRCTLGFVGCHGNRGLMLTGLILTFAFPALNTRAAEKVPDVQGRPWDIRTLTPGPTALPTVLPDAVESLAAGYQRALAESFYSGREKLENVEHAAAVYQTLLQKNPGDSQIAWRLARCYWWLTRHASGPRQRGYYAAARAAAAQALRAAPNAKESLFWYAACLSPACDETIFDLLAAGESIRTLERLMAVNPRHGRACYWLSVLYRQTPGWPLSYGDLQKSLIYAQRSLVNSPGEIFPLLALAETLVAMDKKSEAKALLLAALQQPGSPDQQPETREDRARVQQLLEALEKQLSR